MEKADERFFAWSYYRGGGDADSGGVGFGIPVFL
jgi:hypothetical protein